MKTWTFTRINEDAIILVGVRINNDEHEIILALDTAASHTVIDFTNLLIAGCDRRDVLGKTELETAKGTIVSDIYQVHSIEALGIKRTNFRVSSYDFMFANNLFEVSGILGLDFFEDEKICIDFKRGEITVHE